MIVRRVKDVLNTERDVRAPTFASRRLLLRDDGMGFSMHETTIFAGTETYIWYKHHLEAVYCVEGSGEVELIPSGEVFRIEPGTVYALNKNDRHWLRADPGADLRVVCAFNPALAGDEVHDADGAYAPAPETTKETSHAIPRSLSEPYAGQPGDPGAS
ncbi:MAG: L-ectoine synthase [Burkholderiales bacterium]|jgi:L-ectoine synthase